MRRDCHDYLASIALALFVLYFMLTISAYVSQMRHDMTRAFPKPRIFIIASDDPPAVRAAFTRALPNLSFLLLLFRLTAEPKAAPNLDSIIPIYSISHA